MVRSEGLLPASSVIPCSIAFALSGCQSDRGPAVAGSSSEKFSASQWKSGDRFGSRARPLTTDFSLGFLSRMS